MPRRENVPIGQPSLETELELMSWFARTWCYFHNHFFGLPLLPFTFWIINIDECESIEKQNDGSVTQSRWAEN